jgi:lipoprotein NlpI
LGAGDYERAAKDLNEAIRISPEGAMAYNARGNAYLRKKEFDAAIADFDKAIQLDAGQSSAFVGRGRAYGSKQEYDRALQDFNQAIRINPKDSDALRSRGIAFNLQKDYKRALADFENAVRLNPSAANHSSISRVLFYMGRFEQSAVAADKALTSAPQDKYMLLWRYLARAKATGAQAARRELSDGARRLTDRSWPDPVIALFLDQITEDSFFLQADDSDPKRKAELICEAKFYVAESRLLSGKNQEAITLLQSAEAECPIAFVEKRAASVELERMAKP